METEVNRGKNFLGVEQEEAAISAEAVSGNYFGLLGATPVEGRLLRPDDDRPGAEPAMVVSHAFWRNRLALAPLWSCSGPGAAGD